jgi:hypothetical protein
VLSDKADISFAQLFILGEKMNVNLFCMWCGGRLGTEGGHVTCIDCGTKFSDMLVSETRYGDAENTFLEMSVSMDCVKVKRKCSQEIYPIVTEESAVVCE